MGADGDRQTTVTADNMISALIFSKDRALQLDGMLRSLFKWAGEVESATLTVLYATSDAQLHIQYRELEREYANRVRFVEETDFRGQVLQLVGADTSPKAARPIGSLMLSKAMRWGHAQPALARRTAHILFLVDDTLLFRPFSLRVASDALEDNRQAIGFSLRLGKNTVDSYVLRREQSLPSFQAASHGVIKYRWAGADGDFAYPLELSSSLYRAENIAPLLRALRFTDPNTLESQMSLNARRFRRRFPFLLCWEDSVAFSAPVNRVQEVYTNRSGEQLELSVASLARIFEGGQRMDIEVFEGFRPRACHQEVSLAFKPKVPMTGDRS